MGRDEAVLVIICEYFSRTVGIFAVGTFFRKDVAVFVIGSVYSGIDETVFIFMDFGYRLIILIIFVFKEYRAIDITAVGEDSETPALLSECVIVFTVPSSLYS